MRVLATIGVPRKRRKALPLRAFVIRNWYWKRPPDRRPPNK
jgi:hypothetical protein